MTPQGTFKDSRLPRRRAPSRLAAPARSPSRSVPTESERPRGGGPPAAPPTVTRERVRRLLEQGYARAKIAETLGIARSTVTYHAGRLGAGIDGRFARRYDWRAISRFYERGHSVADCQAMFGFDRNAWHDAVNRGLITPRPARLPLDQLLIAGVPRNRNHIKRRLFEAGLKTRRCDACGRSKWRGHPIPLALHHVNGARHDNRLENLQILCANCHSLTDTWAGRNFARLRQAAQAKTAETDAATKPPGAPQTRSRR